MAQRPQKSLMMLYKAEVVLFACSHCSNCSNDCRSGFCYFSMISQGDTRKEGRDEGMRRRKRGCKGEGGEKRTHGIQFANNRPNNEPVSIN